MSNQEQRELTHYNILSLANILGVASHVQIVSQGIAHPKRIALHTDKLVALCYLDELPARFYYGSAKGRPSPVYRLTQAGADWLTEHGHSSARPSGLKGEESINHALAVLDCRLALARDVPRGTIVTDRAIHYGQSVIRPDNLLTFKDNLKAILIESEGLGNARNSRSRIRRKVEHLTDFFLSEAGAGYDSDVRIIYLWRPSQHERARTLWVEACFSERRRRNLPALPFRPLFISHADFLRYSHLSPERYESLSAGSVEATPEAKRLYAAPTNVEPPRATPAAPQAGLLDEATLTFLRDFRALNDEPIRDNESYCVLLALLHDFLVSRGETLCERLGQALSPLAHPTSHVTAGYAMEHAAMLLLSNLGIPALATDAESYNRPVALSAVGDGRARPTLTIRVNSALAERLLVGWREGGDDLGKTLMALFHVIFSACRDLDIATPKERRGRRRDYFG